ncbi:MAG: NADH-quinone oxidoreductase subunit C [Planctomycetota bacterium]|nr:MAG: NADH-quinone oxidoreductase subunit C [Planctomycetota bacterium]
MSKKKKKRKSQKAKKVDQNKVEQKKEEVKEEVQAKVEEASKKEMEEKKEKEEQPSPKLDEKEAAQTKEEEKKEPVKPSEETKKEEEQVSKNQEVEEKEESSKEEPAQAEKKEEESPKEVSQEKKEEQEKEKQPSFRELVEKDLGDKIQKWEVKCGQDTLTIDRSNILEVLQYFKEKEGLEFIYLTDITALDCLLMKGAPERFAMVYHLYSFKRNQWVRIKAYVPEKEAEVDSATSLWKKANWLEREVYDMFGIHFRNHPDLRRILMPDDFPAHPLRKDYPLQGRGERDNFPRVS